MRFVIFRCVNDPDFFIVTDEAHVAQVGSSCCPSGGELERLGEYGEMGDQRVAFDETLAKNSIEHQGFYRFEARSFDPVAQPPGTMPG